jgi:hypothetical protein
MNKNEIKSTGEGKNILAAFKAIARFHSDTSKLLVDCDKRIGKGRRPVFGNWATRELTYHVKADFWMPEGMFRYYEAGPGLVDGVAVTFFNAAGITNPQLETEPLFQVARIQYKFPEIAGEVTPDIGDGIKAVCNAWDIWSLFFKETKDRAPGRLFEYADIDNGRIASARLIAVPLLSIGRIEDAQDLMNQVVNTPSA